MQARKKQTDNPKNTGLSKNEQVTEKVQRTSFFRKPSLDADSAFRRGKKNIDLDNLQDAKLYFKETLRLAMDEDNLKLKVLANLYLGVCYKKLEQPSKAVPHLQAVMGDFNLAFSKPTFEDQKNYANAHYHLGECLFLQQDNNEALKVFRQAVMLFNKLGLESARANALLQVGILHNLKKEYQLAQPELMKAYKAFVDLNTGSLSVADVAQQLGFCLVGLGKYSNAIQYLNEVLNIYQNGNSDVESYATTLLLLATAHAGQGFHREADVFLRKVIDIFNGSELTGSDIRGACNIIRFFNDASLLNHFQSKEFRSYRALSKIIKEIQELRSNQTEAQVQNELRGPVEHHEPARLMRLG